MSWQTILRILRSIHRLDRRGVLITLRGETRFYYRGQWCTANFRPALRRALVINLDWRPRLPRRAGQA